GLIAARRAVAQQLRDPMRVSDAALFTSLAAAVLPAALAGWRFGIAGALWAAGTATATSLAFIGAVSTLAPPNAIAGPGVRKRDLIVGATVALGVAGWASIAALLVGGQKVLGLPHGGPALTQWVPLFGPAFLLFTYAVAASAGRALADDVDRARQAIAD